MLIKDDQSEIARKINKSRQVISDMKSGKCKANIVVVALLMKEYPLLPWTEFISGFINE
jgi:predicted transcriptional regulator